MGALSGIHDRTTQSQPATRAREQATPFHFDDRTATRVARGLGWFSIGLGMAELMTPRLIGRITGARNHHGLIRTYGLRELAAGIGILTAARPTGWLWSRVAGDAIDLGSLGAVMRSSKKGRGKAVFSAAAVAGVTALDVWCARRLGPPSLMPARYGSRAEANLIVNRSPGECYSFWRDFERLPRFMSHLESVRTSSERRSHWIARLPGGGRVEWDAEVVDDLPNERISWRSLPDSDLRQTGSVEFERAPGDRGTIVRVSMEYSAPVAGIASAAATLTGKHPEQIIRKELLRFKQAIETGEAITTEGQPAGRRNSVTWLDRIAR